MIFDRHREFRNCVFFGQKPRIFNLSFRRIAAQFHVCFSQINDAGKKRVFPTRKICVDIVICECRRRILTFQLPRLWYDVMWDRSICHMSIYVKLRFITFMHKIICGVTDGKKLISNMKVSQACVLLLCACSVVCRFFRVVL